MVDHPRFTYTDAGEPAIAATLEPEREHNFATPSRETFVLSTKAAGLIVDELEYEEREEIAPETVETIFLTGGLSVPDEKMDPVDLVQRLRLPPGGKHPTDAEIERVAAYLKSAGIEKRVRWIAVELVEESRLSTAMEPEEIKTQRERMNDLRGIAKDL